MSAKVAPVAQLATDLDTMLARHGAELDTLAERVRNGIVAPACRKHKLRFLSGMGTFYFLKTQPGHECDLMVGEAEPSDFNKLTRAAQLTLRPILELLSKNTNGDHSLGMWISDYTPGED